MPKISGSIEVEAPVETVSNIGLDVAAWPRWTPGLVSAEPSSTFPEIGSEVDLHYRVAGVPITIKLTLSDYIENEKLGFTFTGTADGTNTWSFRQIDIGTEVSVSLDFEVPGGDVGSFIFKGFVQNILVDTMLETLESLAANAEQQYKDASVPAA